MPGNLFLSSLRQHVLINRQHLEDHLYIILELRWQIHVPLCRSHALHGRRAVHAYILCISWWTAETLMISPRYAFWRIRAHYGMQEVESLLKDDS